MAAPRGGGQEQERIRRARSDHACGQLHAFLPSDTNHDLPLYLDLLGIKFLSLVTEKKLEKV